MASIDRSRVFLDINIGEEPAGRLVIELFTDKTPKTCENFRQLCTGQHHGLSYAKAPFHRVIDEFMVQGGDIDNGDGTGVASIYDGEFEDENLHWREMDATGLVCSANRGRDTNGSQFFITLEPCTHLNGKHTIFGRLVSGEDNLLKIAKVKVDGDDRPVLPVLISRCGELERKRRREANEGREASEAYDNRERGRHRRSMVSVSRSPSQDPVRQLRRQSDNIMDEGLRGRPRQRSGSRSRSQSISSEGMDQGAVRREDASPPKQHKRKRSSSPSRHQQQEREDGELEFERRRRSLPNQYANERRYQRSPEGDRYRPSPRRGPLEFAGRKKDDWHSKRSNDRYRPSDRDGSLGGDRLGEDGASNDGAPVKFKGRGVMKFRESDRW